MCACSTSIPTLPRTDELVQRTEEFNKAFSLRDVDALQKLMVPEYMFHYIDQSTIATIRAIPNAPRGRWPADMFARLSNGPLEWSVIDARIVGNFGIVSSYYRWAGSFNGQSFRYAGYMTDVWVRRRGEWRILFSTADLLPPVNG